MVQIDVIRFVSNEYRLKLLQFNMLFCDLLKRNFYHAFDLRFNNGTLVQECPLLPIKYGIFNQEIRADQLPPNIPVGSYKLRFLLKLANKEIMVISGFGEVVNKKN